jgi:hypothetical protein
MIYRIAIYRNDNGKMVFDHYATKDELYLLKVAPDGRVFNMVQSRSSDPPMRPVIDWYQINNTIYSLEWQDVSETHRVEWGFTFEGNQYFQNDILKVWITKCDDEQELNEFYYAKIYYDHTYDCLMIHDTCLEYDYTFANYAIEWYNNSDSFDSWEVSGNIHQNPELLEVKE